MLKGIAVSALLVATNHAAYAANGDPPTAWELVAQCRGGAPELVGCMNYLRGVWDGLSASSMITKKPFVCGNVQAGTMRKAFLAYALNHQDDLHYESGVVATVALSATFPCGQGS